MLQELFGGEETRTRIAASERAISGGSLQIRDQSKAIEAAKRLAVNRYELAQYEGSGHRLFLRKPPYKARIFDLRGDEVIAVLHEFNRDAARYTLTLPYGGHIHIRLATLIKGIGDYATKGEEGALSP